MNGPVTNNNPLANCFKKTTRLPRKRPARRMRTVPGVMDERSLVGFSDLRHRLGWRMSSAGYRRGAFCKGTVRVPPFFGPPILTSLVVADISARRASVSANLRQMLDRAYQGHPSLPHRIHPRLAHRNNIYTFQHVCMPRMHALCTENAKKMLTACSLEECYELFGRCCSQESSKGTRKVRLVSDQSVAAIARPARAPHHSSRPGFIFETSNFKTKISSVRCKDKVRTFGL